MIKPVLTVIAIVFALCIPIADSQSQDNVDPRAFYELHQPLAGVYQTANEKIVIGLIAGADIIYFQRPSTGDMRFMAKDGGNYQFRYSPTRNSTDLSEGHIVFRLSAGGEVNGLTWTDASGAKHVAQRIPGHTADIQFTNGDEAVLHGSLVLPDGKGPFPGAVVIPQDDRTSLWDVGMWLYSTGLAVLVYDQRNNEIGLSTGDEVSGGHSRSTTGLCRRCDRGSPLSAIS